MGLTRSVTTPVNDVGSALYRAAQYATLAPSFLNTQPWRWRVGAEGLDLFADLDRAVTSVDPDRRLLTISCGAALHHACVALRAEGLTPEIQRCPDAGCSEHLASITIADEHPATPAEVELAHAIEARRSERRSFSAGKRVAPSDVDLLRRRATLYGALLHQVSDDQRRFLATAVRSAAAIEGRQEPYQSELRSWTDLRRSGEGVVATDLANRARPVAVPDSTTSPGRVHAAFGEDRDAEYLILATRDDMATDWLRAGEALSAAWLTAITQGIAGSVLTNLSEVPGARALIASLLPEPGQPQVVLRIGIPTWPAPAATPRRRPETMITVETP
ncbi:MAG TPA: nitroreductase [Micromonosporaceae bacterium]|jgi:hypothetical protein